MGSDLTKENEPDIEKDFQDEYIKYGIISKKCKEQSNDDNYIYHLIIIFQKEI